MDEILRFLFGPIDIGQAIQDMFWTVVVPSAQNLAKAGIVLFLTIRIADQIHHLVRRLLARQGAAPNVQGLLGRMAYLGILIIGILVVLRIFGVDPATVVAIVGVFGLAASLAAQDILKNFFSGLYLLVERPFQIGDKVKIGDNIGVIEDVGFRVTRLRTSLDQIIYVPNATVFSSTLINETNAKKPAPAVDAEDSGKHKED